MQGFYNINKPVGMTSNFALSIFKRKTGIRKCGYAGTLDPFASGVLPIAVNSATKLIESFVDVEKEYSCIAEFGKETDTGDTEGEVILATDVIPSIEILNEKIKPFIGIIIQSPSIYSAVKINGERLCDIARSGKHSRAELQEIADSRAKQINVMEFSVFPTDKSNFFIFKIKCGKGTYVRQLISDLARSAGSFAYLTQLIRTRVGEFNIEDSIFFDDLKSLA